MIVGRLLGWIVLILGIIVLGRDLIGWTDTHRLEPVVLGQLWFDLSRDSLDFAETFIRNVVSPALWDRVISFVLEWWAAPSFIVLGIALLILFRRRERIPDKRWLNSL